MAVHFANNTAPIGLFTCASEDPRVTSNALKIYLLNSTAPGSSHGAAQIIGSAPTAATTSTGWTLPSGANVYSDMAFNSLQASTTFTSTQKPAGAPGTTNCFRTSSPLTGSFASGTWQINVQVALSAAVTGVNLKCRIWHSPDPTGATSVAEITTSTLTLSTASASGNTSTTVTSGTLPAVTLNNEYLFFEFALESGGASSSPTCKIRVGSTTNVLTPTFTNGPPSSACSVACFARVTTGAAGAVVVEMDNGNGSTAGWEIQADATSGTWQLVDSGATTTITGPTYVLGQWYFVAAVINGTAATFYVKPVGAVGATIASATFAAPYTPVGISLGFEAPSNGFGFTGDMCGVKVWRGALSIAELDAESRQIAPARTCDLWDWWELKSTADLVGGSQRSTVLWESVNTADLTSVADPPIPRVAPNADPRWLATFAPASTNVTVSVAGSTTNARPGTALVTVATAIAGRQVTAQPGAFLGTVQTQSAGATTSARTGAASVSAWARASIAGAQPSTRPGVAMVTVATASAGVTATARPGSGTVSRADAVLSLAGGTTTASPGVPRVTVATQSAASTVAARPGAASVSSGAIAGVVGADVTARQGTPLLTVATATAGGTVRVRAGTPVVAVATSISGSRTSARPGTPSVTVATAIAGGDVYAQSGSASVAAGARASVVGGTVAARPGAVLVAVSTAAVGGRTSAAPGTFLGSVRTQGAGATVTARPGVGEVETGGSVTINATGSATNTRPGAASVSAGTVVSAAGAKTIARPGNVLVAVSTAATGASTTARPGAAAVTAGAVVSTAGGRVGARIGIATPAAAARISGPGSTCVARPGTVSAAAGAGPAAIGARAQARPGASVIIAGVRLSMAGAIVMAQPGAASTRPVRYDIALLILGSVVVAQLLPPTRALAVWTSDAPDPDLGLVTETRPTVCLAAWTSDAVDPSTIVLVAPAPIVCLAAWSSTASSDQ